MQERALKTMMSIHIPSTCQLFHRGNPIEFLQLSLVRPDSHVFRYVLYQTARDPLSLAILPVHVEVAAYPIEREKLRWQERLH